MKLVVALVLLAACPKHDKQTIEPQKSDAQSRLLPMSDAGVAPAAALPAIPAGLPALAYELPTPDEVALGALLFAEPRMSATAKLACATCHDPARGFTGTARPRPSPLVDLAWVTDFGVDPRGAARFAHLDDKIAGHIADQMFPPADGSPEAAALANERELAILDGITRAPSYAPYLARITGPGMSWLRALTAFVATRYEGDSPWDRVERSADAPAELKAGYRLFTGKAQCAVCHTPPLYTDRAPHQIAGAAVITPTLRGAAQRAAFLHDGGAATLDTAIDHPFDHKGSLTPAEHAQLVAFVHALSKGPR